MSRFTTVWPQQISPLLLQKLEEFLFCMEDNHPEVGNVNTVTACLNVICVIKVSVTLTPGLQGHGGIN